MPLAPLRAVVDGESFDGDCIKPARNVGGRETLDKIRAQRRAFQRRRAAKAKSQAKKQWRRFAVCKEDLDCMQPDWEPAKRWGFPPAGPPTHFWPRLAAAMPLAWGGSCEEKSWSPNRPEQAGSRRRP